MKTIADLCKSHRTRTYFVDPPGEDGLVGVYNHRNMVVWYRMTEAGYSMTGSTETPQGAQERKLDK